MGDKGRARTGKDAGASFAAGALSGILTTAVLQPFDVVKTHLQARHSVQEGGPVSQSQGEIARPASHLTAREVVVGIYKKEGLKGLWRGTGPSVLRVGLGAGLYFAMLDHLLATLRAAHAKPVDSESVIPLPLPIEGQEDAGETENQRATSGGGEGKPGGKGGSLPAYVTVGAGALSRSLAAAMLSPITVVKTRMEYAAVTGDLYTSTWHAVSTISRKEGIRGLFSGLGPTLLRDAPYSGLYLLMYDRTRQLLREKVVPENTRQTIVNLAAGAVAGSASTLLTHPPDVIRTRMQLLQINGGGGLPSGIGLGRPTTYGTAKQILEAEGVRGLFRGAVPRVTKRASQMAFSWTIYEELLQIFSGRSIWGHS